MKKITHSTYEELCAKWKLKVPSDFNVGFDVLARKAEETPDALCIRHIDNDFRLRDVTFKELDEAASRVANALKTLGVKKGDKVFLVLYRRLEWWQAVLGLNKIGAVAIPAPSQLTAHDIEYRLNSAEVSALIVEDSFSGKIDEVKDICPTVKLKIQVGKNALPSGWHDYDAVTAQASPAFPRPRGDDLACGSDPFMIFFSSGTTGMPKMVLHDCNYPLGHLFTGLYWHNLCSDDIHMTMADTGWAKSVWGKTYGQWMAGAAVMVYDYRGKFNPAVFFKTICDNGVTSFCAPPTTYRFLLQEDFSQFDTSGLRHCTTAGELLNESVFHEWKAKTGLNIYEGYGQTETTLQLATLPCMTPKPGSLGKPVPGLKLALLDADGVPCPAGEEGEICLSISDGRPIGLYREYMSDPERTASVNYDGWYHTGDKAWMDEDGYYWFMGRVDDLIKSSGYRIGPFEVESALVAHEAVIEAAVTGIPDPVRGQLVKATVVLAPGFTPGDELTKTLQNHVKAYTAPYKYPRVVEYVDELPKTISGKIRRAEIRAKDMAAGNKD